MLLLRLARSIKEKIIDWLGCVLFFFVVDFTLKGLSVVIFPNNTSLTLPLFIKVLESSQESEQACGCV
jgi:hypothetical protein